ncbi:MAG: hypothetical protein AAF632_07030 [Bacteroidota bacterium]
MVNVSFLFPAIASRAVTTSRWLGEWQVHWKNSLGEQFIGSSRLSRPREDDLLKEELHVDAPENWHGWQGTTLAKFNPKNKTWHYAWQDNRGGYCDFIGQFTNRIFSLQFMDANGKQVMQRMVIRSFSRKQLIWECEKYEDKTWRKSWWVEYRRSGNVNAAIGSE